LRALWVKAPWALLRSPGLFLAVAAAAFVVALSATSALTVQAGVESESLKGQLKYMSPFAAGLVVKTAARAGSPLPPGIRTLATQEPSLGPAVVTEQVGPVFVGNPLRGQSAVLMFRTNALEHVTRLTPPSSNGVWISSSMSESLQLRPGGELRLIELTQGFRTKVVRLRVAGIYRALDQDLGNAYWANFTSLIRARNPDSDQPPQFVLMSKPAFDRVAGPRFERWLEFPVDVSRMSLPAAKRLEARLRVLEQGFAKRDSALSRSFACAPRCAATSELSAAIDIARGEVALVSRTVSLLADFAILISLCCALGVGLFVVRRRADEVRFLETRGEASAAYAARVGIEAILPALVGLASGIGVALAALGLFAPSGTIDSTTVAAAIEHAVVAGCVALGAIVLGAAIAFPGGIRLPRGLHRLSRVPWEVLPLAVVAVILVALRTGGGLTTGASGQSHPRLIVFVAPVLAAAGCAGLALRLVRYVVARVHPTGTSRLLASRRLAAAGALLAAATLVASAAFAGFAYARTLSTSLRAGVGLKAYVATGGDVQGPVNAGARIIDRFSFPAAVVDIDSTDVTLDGGGPLTVIAGDPHAVASSLARSDASRQLHALASAPRGGPLPVVTVGSLHGLDAISIRGKRTVVTEVGHVGSFPGTEAGQPAIIVQRDRLPKTALSAVSSFVWAKGDRHVIERALTSSSLQPVYLTTAADLTARPEVLAAIHSYDFFDWLAIASAGLALCAVLLYLYARQRKQLVASALMRRMGIPWSTEAVALGGEALAIVAVAVLAGLVAGLGVARFVVPKLDPLEAWPPALAMTVPNGWLAACILVALAVAVAGGVAAALVSRRSEVAEELRVA
jgi:hypothetical protein